MSRFVPKCPPNQDALRQFGEADDVGGLRGVRARIIAHHFATLFQIMSGGAQRRGFGLWRNEQRPAVLRTASKQATSPLLPLGPAPCVARLSLGKEGKNMIENDTVRLISNATA